MLIPTKAKLELGQKPALLNLIRTTLFNETQDQVREQGFDALNRLVLQRDALGNEQTHEYNTRRAT